MVIHSGSELLGLAYFATLITAIGFVASVGILVARKFRTAAKVAAASVAVLAVYFVSATTIWWLHLQESSNSATVTAGIFGVWESTR